jgi:hypothetical protein
MIIIDTNKFIFMKMEKTDIQKDQNASKSRIEDSPFFGNLLEICNSHCENNSIPKSHFSYLIKQILGQIIVYRHRPNVKEIAYAAYFERSKYDSQTRYDREEFEKWWNADYIHTY